jgi:hypothetical protein
MGHLRDFWEKPGSGALVFFGYGCMAIACLWLSGLRKWPPAVANAMTVFGLPLIVLEAPLDPILRRLGLVVTAYWSFPKIEGLVLVVVLWTMMLAGAGWLYRLVRSAGR